MAGGYLAEQCEMSWARQRELPPTPETTQVADEYVGEVLLAARHYDEGVLAVNGFRDDLLRVTQALEIVIRLHRPLGSGRRAVCLSCHTDFPCHTRSEVTRRLMTRLLPAPESPHGQWPALFGPGRAAATAGQEA